MEQPERLNGLGELGYENMGYKKRAFKTVLAVEKNEYSARTFRKNFDAEVKTEDIRSIKNFTGVSNIHVVVGGIPCQGFSNLNSVKTEDLEDERNELWRHFMSAIRDIDPDVFLIENVHRFLSSKEGIKTIGKAEQLGYTTIAETLWAHEFGVPQKRRRSFILGSKLGIPFFPEPLQGDVKTVRDAIQDLPSEPTGENLHVGRDVTERSERRMESVPPGGNRFDIPEDLLPPCWKNHNKAGTDLYGRLWWDKPSVTIRTEFVKPEKGRYLHPVENRSITMREGARLQTLPDDFEFSTEYKKYITPMIGNAVPPKLAYHLGVAIKAHLEGIDSSINEKIDSDHEYIQESKSIGWDTLSQYTIEELQ